MAKCPDCGKDVKSAKKTWKMAGKPDKAGKRTELTIGLFECCGKTFRQVLDKKKIQWLYFLLFFLFFFTYFGSHMFCYINYIFYVGHM